MRRDLAIAVLGGAGALVVASCGSEAVGSVMTDAGRAVMAVADAAVPDAGPDGPEDSGMADALRDAAQVLLDAGAALDSGTDSAVAQGAEPMVFEGDCDQESGFRVTFDGSATSTTTSYFAEFELGSLNVEDIESIMVARCELEYFGPAPGVTCPDTATSCQNIGAFPLAPLTCSLTAIAEVENGRIRVGCGSQSESRTSEGQVTRSGQRYRRVRVVARLAN